MDHEVILRELRELDSEERFAMEYARLSGSYLNFGQFLYILKYKPLSDPVEVFRPLQVAHSMDELQKSFHASYYAQDYLAEQHFIAEGHTIQVEKLLRYIELPAHKHDYLELAYVVSGSCRHSINGILHEQTAGTLMVVPTFREHQLIPVGDSVCLTIKVRMDSFLKYEIPDKPYYSASISFPCGDDPLVRGLVLSLYQQELAKRPYQDALMEHFLQALLLYCSQNYKDSLELLDSAYEIERSDLDVLNYMYENYQTVTLHSMAQKFGASDSYLSSRIKKVLGRNFQTILREYRLRQAANLLEDTRLPLNTICERVGIGDVTQFIRNFKTQYGCTPGKYRAQHRKSDQEE